ncbi:MAG: tetratricopeptide repeat protein [Cyanobacteria bacterium P01_H01_bin.74]
MLSNQQFSTLKKNMHVFFLLIAIVLPGFSAFANPGVIQDINYNKQHNQLVIQSTAPILATINTSTISGKTRAVIDLNNAEIGLTLPQDRVLKQKLSAILPQLSAIDINQYSGSGEPIVRILLEFSKISSQIQLQKSEGNQVTVFVDSNDEQYLNGLEKKLAVVNDGKPEDLTLQAIPKKKGDSQKKTKSYATVPYSDTPIRMPQPKAQNSEIKVSEKSNTAVLDAQIEVLQAELQGVKAENALLKPAIKETNDYLIALKKENERLEQDLQTVQKYHIELESEKKRQEERLQAELRQAQSKLSDNDLALAKNLEALKRELQEAKRQLTSNAIEETKEIETLNNQLQLIENEKQSLEAVVNTQRQELTRLKNKSKSVVTDKTALTALKNQLNEAQSTLKASIDTTNALNQKNAFLQNQLIELKSTYNTVSNTQSESLALENEQLRKQVDILSSKIQALSAQLESGPKKQNENDLTVGKLQANLSAEKRAKALIREQLQKATQKNETLTLELNTFKTQLERNGNASNTLAGIKGALDDKNKIIESLEQQYQKAKTESESNKVLVEKLRSQLVSGRQAKNTALKLTSVEAQNQKLRDQLNALQAEFSEKTELTVTSTTLVDASTNYAEAEASYKAGNLQAALRSYKTAMLLSPDDFQYVSAYSRVLLEDKQYAEAEETLKKYLEKHPGNREAYAQLGKIYLLDEQPQIASQIFSKAVPSNTLNNYGSALKKLGKLKEAENVFNVALSLNPKDSELLFNLGNLYNTQNKLQAARNKYLEALDVAPDFSEAHYNLGLVFSKIGDKPNAIKHLEQFLGLVPTAKNASVIRSYIKKLKNS